MKEANPKISRLTLCASIFIIISVSVERYLAVCRPHHYREVQGKRNRVIMYILPALVAAVIINLSKFWEVRLLTFCEDFQPCGCGIVTQ